MTAAAATPEAAAARPFPWREVLHTGLCLLRLDPARLWTMTPIEFHAATGGLKPPQAAPARPALDALMRSFPDDRPDGDKEA